MRKMKDSGIEWIREIPEDWEVVKVKHIFNRKNEKAKLDNPVVLSLTRNGVKVRDISNNEGQLAESYYDYNPVSKGDLLLNPMDLYSGANCSVSNVEGVISPAYANLRAKNDNNPIYYDYYFKTQYWSMALFAHGKGVSFNNRWTLNNETLMNYFLPHPNIEEQNIITEYINNKVSEIDNIISKTKETIEKYKKYKQSVITEAVTKGLNPDVEMKDSGIEWIGEIPKDWEVVKIKAISNFINGFSFDSSDLLIDGEYPVIRIGDLKNGKVDFKNACKSNLSDTNLKSHKIMKDDILIAMSGATVGKLALVKKEPVKSYINQRVGIIRSKEFKFIYYSLLNNAFIQYINLLSNGSAQPNISMNGINEYKIVFPKNTVQRIEIINYLDSKVSKIDNLISKKEQLIFELEQYKKSLIYEYVTGKKEVK